MSRSFFSRPPPTTRDQSPLLPQHRNSVPLSPLSPRSSISADHRSVSPSPPPSFYRDMNSNNISPRDLSSSRNPSVARSYEYRDAERTSSQNSDPNARYRTERTFSESPTPRPRIQFAAPPPPISASVLLPQSRNRSARPSSTSSFGSRSREREQDSSGSIIRVRRGSGGIDPLLGLQRRERALQKELQLLLDAQSAGLIQGFGGDQNADGEGSEAGSSTPTMSVTGRAERENGRGSVIPVRQPKRKPISLRGARKGLKRDMNELITIKTEEISILSHEIARRQEVLERVAAWEARINGVKRKLGLLGPNAATAAATDTSDDGAGGERDRELEELQIEEKALESEIRDTEDRLAQMHARQQYLRQRIREGENRREARLSSYRGALRDLEGEVREFLKRPPVEVSVVMGEEESFTSLPVNRRTLGMAREWWMREISSLSTRKNEVEDECKALEEGSEMWERCMEIVMGFEDELQVQMQKGPSADMFKGQIEKMGTCIEKLEEMFGKAEGKGWNLLVCCVGAELEAFKEGKTMLERTLHAVSGSNNENQNRGSENGNGVGSGTGDGNDEELEKEDSFHSTDSGLHTLAELNGAVGPIGVEDDDKKLEVRRQESESEDDGPNLEELLVERSESRESDHD